MILKMANTCDARGLGTLKEIVRFKKSGRLRARSIKNSDLITILMTFIVIDVLKSVLPEIVTSVRRNGVSGNFTSL